MGKFEIGTVPLWPIVYENREWVKLSLKFNNTDLNQFKDYWKTLIRDKHPFFVRERSRKWKRKWTKRQFCCYLGRRRLKTVLLLLVREPYPGPFQDLNKGNFVFIHKPEILKFSQKRTPLNPQLSNQNTAYNVLFLSFWAIYYNLELIRALIIPW